jgi:imidazolonepropionase
MEKVLIKNIKQLVQVWEQAPLLIKNDLWKELPVLENAWLAIENGIIADFGSMEDWPGITDWSNLSIIDAENKLVLPTWCDSHSHLVFAATREKEFCDRINGLSYEEVAARGGGILNSVDKLRKLSEDELFEKSLPRLYEAIANGTGALEIKSGYGLSLETELKILKVIKRIKDVSPITIKSTLLAAHAVPHEFKNNKEGYIKLIINEIIPEVAKQQLADFCDVFCERNYFSEQETIAILEQGNKYGLKAKVHANQLSKSGGVQAGVKCNAISVDHLEFVEDEEIELLKSSNTIPTILPGAAFFLQLQLPPAKQMIKAGLPVAIATDFNPGSSPTSNMNQMISFMCIQYGITPEQAIHAATINGAAAMDLSAEVGSISPGKKANLIITKPCENYLQIPYNFGNNLIESIIINGKII